MASTTYSRHSRPSRRVATHSGGQLAAGMVIVMFVGFFGIVLAAMAAQGGNQPSLPTQAAPLLAGTRIVVTLPPPPTYTPQPTATALPSATPRPNPTRSLALALSVRLNPTEVDTSAAVTELYGTFAARIATLNGATADLDKLLDAPENFSSATLEKVAETAALIQRERNAVMVTNLRAVPEEARRYVVRPAYQAFIYYANAYLYLVKLRVAAYQSYSILTAANAEESPAARNQWEERAQAIDKQATAVRERLDTLNSAFAAFTAYVMAETLREESSGQAITYSSNETSEVVLKAGEYDLAYASESAGILIWLVPTSGEKAAKLELGKASAPGKIVKGQRIRLAEGTYRVQVEGTGWWAFSLEPQD